ncbi:hypothetical protein [Caballeronia telluris]|uniref:hypothetical protein n=1 Tax=Caballeronia telluris TaxID=326475 RepID=UPI000F740A17|nr:hypothetical protein [Caballeronia telluris]
MDKLLIADLYDSLIGCSADCALASVEHDPFQNGWFGMPARFNRGLHANPRRTRLCMEQIPRIPGGDT